MPGNSGIRTSKSEKGRSRGPNRQKWSHMQIHRIKLRILSIRDLNQTKFKGIVLETIKTVRSSPRKSIVCPQHCPQSKNSKMLYLIPISIKRHLKLITANKHKQNQNKIILSLKHLLPATYPAKRYRVLWSNRRNRLKNQPMTRRDKKCERIANNS